MFRLDKSLTMRSILFLILFAITSCNSTKIMSTRDSCRKEVAYVLSNLYSENIFSVKKHGYVFTIFNYSDSKNTISGDFEGTGEIRQGYYIIVQPDGEYVEALVQWYHIQSIYTIEQKSIVISINQEEKTFHITAKNNLEIDVLNIHDRFK